MKLVLSRVARGIVVLQPSTAVHPATATQVSCATDILLVRTCLIHGHGRVLSSAHAPGFSLNNRLRRSPCTSIRLLVGVRVCARPCTCACVCVCVCACLCLCWCVWVCACVSMCVCSYTMCACKSIYVQNSASAVC